jgi:hypothetical protein
MRGFGRVAENTRPPKRYCGGSQQKCGTLEREMNSLREEMGQKRSELAVLRDELAHSGRELAKETVTNPAFRARVDRLTPASK